MNRAEVLCILADPRNPRVDEAVDRALELRLAKAVPLLIDLVEAGHETGRLGNSIAELAGAADLRRVRRIAGQGGPGADEALYALYCRMRCNDAPVLVHVLRTSPVTAHRDRAADALGDIYDFRSERAFGSRKAEKALIAGLSDPEPFVRYTCALSLSKLRSRAALPKLDQLAREDHVRGVDYADRTVADQALEAATWIRSGLMPWQGTRLDLT